MTSRRNSEAGFTMTEVLVAILILGLGAMATFGLLSSAARNAERAKASQVALEYAEQELEYLRSLEGSKLAMTVAPPPSVNPLSPNYRYRVSTGTFALSRQPLGNYQQLVLNDRELYGGGVVEGGVVTPGPTSFTSGDVSGKVFRYVVWRNDEKCSETNCPGKQDYKQIVVAVKLDRPMSQVADRGYLEVQSNFINPTDNSETDPLPNAEGKVITAQQFFFTDTSCSPTGVTERQEILSSHLLHNTLGTCASGQQTGTTMGAPDALLLGSPPDPEPEDPALPAMYDYANDSYLDTTPDTGVGVQIKKDDTNSCHYTPTGTSHPEAQVHRWVTDPMPFNFVMSGEATLEVFTESIANAFSAGKLCVYIFKRREIGVPPVATDTLLTNTSGGTPYWTLYKSPGWPQDLTALKLTMTFNNAPYTIPVGERLGVAFSVERKDTGAQALSFMYDHHEASSRIEIDTSTPIDGT